ncbi:MAG: SAM-dependent methyltransferase [Alteromonadaceae bacterium]|nr:MAG: SAM-dependent methyltransferase [Alteromonadaceae bacterium]
MQTINFKHLNIQAQQTVLDLGCGEGRHTLGILFEHPNTRVIGIDLSFSDLQKAAKRQEEFDFPQQPSSLYSQGDAYSLPFTDHSFDHVICSEVLEHLDDYPKALAEINRVLKPGGSLAVSVPRYWPERICWLFSRAYHEVPGGHVRIFRTQQLRKAIEQYPFQFQHHHWAHALHVPYWWLRCAFWRWGNDFFLTRWYHHMLVWDLMKRPWLTQTLDRLLNPIMGKSIALYFLKQEVLKQKVLKQKTQN